MHRDANQHLQHVQQVLRQLLAADLAISTVRRLPNDTGTQIRLGNDGVVNVFDTGTLQVQGRNQSLVRAAVLISGGPARQDTGIP